jgi:serine/threonine protein kinase
LSAKQFEANDEGNSGHEKSSRPEDIETPFLTRTIGPSHSIAGLIIGAYRLIQRLGHGGMGEVWLAEQKEPVRRRVAIKLIKAGMDTHEVVARFESERQALPKSSMPGPRRKVARTLSWSTLVEFRLRATAMSTSSLPGKGWNYSCACAKACNMRIRRQFCIAI